MTPDEIICEIFRIQNEANPDRDPGDITIDIQDDLDMVIVTQTTWVDKVSDEGLLLDFSPLGTGTTIQAALEDALTNVRKANG